MNICQFTFEYYPVIAGIAVVVEKLSDQLACLGHKITIATPNFFPGKPIDSPHEMVYFPPPPENRITPEWEQKLTEIFSRQLTGIDLIHAHSAMPSGYLCSRRSFFIKRIPIVITCHGGDLFHLPEAEFGYVSRYREFVRQALREASFITTPSQIMKSLAVDQGVSPRKIAVIPHGADILPIGNRQALNEPSLLYLGGLRLVKGVDLLLKAFSLMVEKNRKLKLYIVGEGKERKNLVKLSLQLGLGREVIFKNSVRGKEKEDLLQGCRLVMVPSRFESFGMTVLEAGAAGKPVVAFDVGGISEIVVNLSTGILIPAGDINKMAEETLKLLDDKERYRKYSAAARARAKGFSWKPIARKYLEIYKSAVSHPNNSGIITGETIII